MKTDETNKFKQTHLEKWHETTLHYLFADQDSLSDATEKELLEPRLDSHDAQDRFIFRTRGRLLRFVKRTAQHDQNPLQGLERAFYFQVSFTSQYPETPNHLLGWLSQGNDTRIRRRIQMVICHYESRLCRMIDQATHQGLIRAGIDPHTAASLFIEMIQVLTLRMIANLGQRELLLRDAFEGFTLYRAGLATPPK